MAKLLVTLLNVSAPCALISQLLEILAAPVAGSSQASASSVLAGTNFRRLIDVPLQTVTDIGITRLNLFMTYKL